MVNFSVFLNRHVFIMVSIQCFFFINLIVIEIVRTNDVVNVLCDHLAISGIVKNYMRVPDEA